MIKSNQVFIVDFDSSVRKGLTRLFLTAGFLVKSFTTIGEFEDYYESETSGCLLMDIGILGMSSEKRIKTMKNYSGRLSIIIVSSNDSQESKKIAKDIGAVAFFQKPVDGYALIDAINWTLNIR